MTATNATPATADPRCPVAAVCTGRRVAAALRRSDAQLLELGPQERRELVVGHALAPPEGRLVAVIAQQPTGILDRLTHEAGSSREEPGAAVDNRDGLPAIERRERRQVAPNQFPDAERDPG